MSPDALAIMFTDKGRASPYLHKRWKAKGALEQLQPLAIYVTGGYAKPSFRSLWSRAFPTKDPLPEDAIVTRDMRFTREMLGIWFD